MSHLLRIAYGPVQSFISAARKTRDLKAGSDLLVELGQTMVRKIRQLDPDVQLIFPATEDGACANILQMVVTGDPAQLARAAKAAGIGHLVDEVAKLKGIDGAAVAAKAQAERFLELYAAWVPLGPGAPQKLDERMAARKAVRDFEPAPEPLTDTPAGERKHYPPKSPLLPEFDSVVPMDREGLRVLKRVAGPYHLSDRECLDALSLLKRSRKQPFPSTRMIAIHDMVEIMPPYARAVYDQASEMLKGTQYDEGDWLFKQVEEDDDVSDVMLRDLETKRDDFMRIMKDVEGFRLRPYYAVLHADGDHMGRALGKLTEVGEMQAFSQKLDRFGQLVRERLPQEFGTVVFAGGDDVLAMVPMPRAMSCARLIREAFSDAMSDTGTSLSLGIAIVHVTEDLREAVALSKKMEAFAKKIDDEKDAVAITVRNRGGGEITVRDKWVDAHSIENLITFFDTEDAPRGFPYEVRDAAMALRQLGDRIPAWTVRGTYQRLANKKDKPTPRYPDEITSAKQLAEHADRMIIAHFMTRGGQED